MKASKINEISIQRYGYNVISIDPIAALWLVEHIYKETGENVYKTVSRERNKAGKLTRFPEYGTPLFRTL